MGLPGQGLLAHGSTMNDVVEQPSPWRNLIRSTARPKVRAWAWCSVSSSVKWA